MVCAFRLNLSLAVVVLAFVVGTALSTVPTPLYPLYERLLGFDAMGVTVIFAVFAVGAVLGLLFIAPLAAKRGRRLVLAVACSFQALAAGTLAFVPGVAGFTIGRILTGIGVGILASSMTVFIREIAAGNPNSRLGRVVVSLSPSLSMIGLAVGPIVGGITRPQDFESLHNLYLVFAVILAACALCSGMVPRLPLVAGPVLLASSTVPRSALLGAFLAFSSTGLFGALTPTLLYGIEANTPPVTVGLTVGVIFLAGAIAPLLGIRWPHCATLSPGLIAIVTGLAGIGLAVWFSSMPGFIAAGVLTGAGGGILFTVSLRGALSSVAPGGATRAASLTFASAYAGLAVPIVTAGALLRVLSTSVVMGAFIAEALVLAALVGWMSTRSRVEFRRVNG